MQGRWVGFLLIAGTTPIAGVAGRLGSGESSQPTVSDLGPLLNPLAPGEGN